MSYRFNGFLDDVYATLVVRLHHTGPFDQDELWRYAADFRTRPGKRQLGVKLTRRAEGAGELEVYFDPAIPLEEKIIFARYVHEHLGQNAKEVVRLRHYVPALRHAGGEPGSRDGAAGGLVEATTCGYQSDWATQVMDQRAERTHDHLCPLRGAHSAVG